MNVPPGADPPWSPNSPPSPGAPSGRDHRRRWIVLGVSFAVVVAVVVGSLVWRGVSTRNDADNAPAAVDDGVDRTVGLLRDKDPVCDEWLAVSNELAEKEEKWIASNRGVPATAWTTEQRETFVGVSQAMSTAADHYESMLPRAKNVVVQELIAQTIVYLRSYVERVPSYTESDNLFAGVAGNFGTAVTYMCSAAQLVPALGSGKRSTRSTVPDPDALTLFMAVEDRACSNFLELIGRQNAQLSGWAAADSTISAPQWTPKQRALNNAARDVIARDAIEQGGIVDSTENPIMADLLFARGEYMQAFADAIPTYTPDDALLWTTATSLGGGLSAACKAANL